METVVIQSAVAPLDATVEEPTFDPETGEPTGTEEVPNPAIAKDEVERAAAQSILDTLPAEVISWQAT
jgi:hypothetical protein